MEAISWEATERRDWREDEEGSGQPVLGGCCPGLQLCPALPRGMWVLPVPAHPAAVSMGAADVLSCSLQMGEMAKLGDKGVKKRVGVCPRRVLVMP